MAEKLASEVRVGALAQLQGWRDGEGRDAIAKLFRFKSFSEAWAFMTRTALKAGQMNHLSLPFIPSIAETLEFCITTGYPFRHA